MKSAPAAARSADATQASCAGSSARRCALQRRVGNASLVGRLPDNLERPDHGVLCTGVLLKSCGVHACHVPGSPVDRLDDVLKVLRHTRRVRLRHTGTASRRIRFPRATRQTPGRQHIDRYPSKRSASICRATNVNSVVAAPRWSPCCSASGIAFAGSVCSVNSFCPTRGPTAIR